ncbi:hypothetical protein LWF15_00590 [Kineosporia rhizophila]|uniref:hypothetical protein n=1 Tax=Kineosporia TaxID=49184 RepID=UPI000AF1070A|nr:MULTISPECIES: hypothetical protein [Kineosporia]MCE0534002.1 hypothetical protein [Kineosporia rhizophila]GLY13542.1 hypothetical protein Kisp01_05580 [Kineosporia sp. NBRC 101677]
MNDSEMDRLIGLAQPTDVPRGALSEAGQELLEEIVSVDPQVDRKDNDVVLLPHPRRQRTKGRRGLATLGVAAAVVAAVAVPTVVFREGESVTPAAPPVSAAPEPASTSNPFLLLDAQGWVVDRVTESTEEEGEMIFRQSTTGKLLEVVWMPVEADESWYEGDPDDPEPEQVTFLGQKALLSGLGRGEFEIRAERGDLFLSVRSRTGERQAFDKLIGHLRQAPAQEWFAAMPDSVVTPDESAAVSAQLLDGVPLPAGFDPSIFVSDRSNTRYHVEFQVVRQVTCAWIGSYAQARAEKDEAGMAEAEDALAGSAAWPATHQMGSAELIGAEPYLQKMSKREAVGDYRAGIGCDY